MTDPITRPPKPARWTSDPDPGFAGALEPSEGKKDDGWQNGEAPAAGHMNWLLQQHAHWLRYLDTVAGEQAVDMAALVAAAVLSVETSALSNQVDVSPSGSDQIEAFAVNPDTGMIIAVGANGVIKRSGNFGRTWDNETADAGYTGTFRTAAYGLDEDGDPRFIIAGTGGMTQWSADDGETWVSNTEGASTFTGLVSGYHPLAPTQSIFVVCSSSDIRRTGDGGVVWSSEGSGSFGSAPSLTFHGGTFVMGVSGGVLTSVDGGNNWVPQSLAVAMDVTDVTYSPVLGFVAVGDGGSDAIVQTSPDGITWTVYLTLPGVDGEAFAAAGTAGACYVFSSRIVGASFSHLARVLNGGVSDRALMQPTYLGSSSSRVALLESTTPRASAFFFADQTSPGKIYRSHIWSPPP